jgi:hypothetical protein
MKMKRNYTIILVFILLFVIINTKSKAQANWSIGARFGPDIAVDATIPLGVKPRLHPSVYITDRFGIGGYFDWMFALSGGPNGLRFYPGVGPEFFFENDFAFHIAGDFGVEYAFDFPLTIGFDWRPGFKVTESFKFKANTWGFTARFRFGEGARLVPAD